MTRRDLLFGLYVLVCALSVTGVLLRGVQTAPGRVLGLPVGLAWVVGWALATFGALALYDRTRPADPRDGEGPR